MALGIEPISAIANLINVGVSKIFPDADAKQKAQLETFLTSLDSQVKVLMTEMSGNTLQRSWRPILMLSITAILVNNYILFPYFSLFNIPAAQLDFPVELWTLLNIGVGGYVIGRSAEKGIKMWKGS